MGEVLGLGITHYPPLAAADEKFYSLPVRRTLDNPGFDSPLRDPANWPAQMREEWGCDDGTATARKHREDLVGEFRRIRDALDEFSPDFVLVWGDDQYENFREDIIPPFCMLCYDDTISRPWQKAPWQKAPYAGNIWGEPIDTEFLVKGNRSAGKSITRGVLEKGIDLAYAYKPLHHEGLAHAFLNSMLYLDYDRKGFPYPLVSCQVNCYGSKVIAQHGGMADHRNPPSAEDLDPPGPSPERCFALGGAIAQTIQEGPYRVAVIASSGWSHGFLNPKSDYLYPDNEADYAFYEALRDGRYEFWRDSKLSDIEGSGQQEILNWHCLAGAAHQLGMKAQYSNILQNYIFNSSKCFAVLS